MCGRTLQRAAANFSSPSRLAPNHPYFSQPLQPCFIQTQQFPQALRRVSPNLGARLGTHPGVSENFTGTP